MLGIPLGILTFTSEGDSLVAIFFSMIVNVVASVVTTPFMAAVLVLIYFDLRVRKEGFDLQLLAQGVGHVSPGAESWTAGPGSGGHWGGAEPMGRRRRRLEPIPRRELASALRKLAAAGGQPQIPGPTAGRLRTAIHRPEARAGRHPDHGRRPPPARTSGRRPPGPRAEGTRRASPVPPARVRGAEGHHRSEGESSPPGEQPEQ